MPHRIPQAVVLRVPLKCYLSSDHVSDATALDPAITISVNGAGFANPQAGATVATEIGNGWYYVDLGTTDTGTLGPLIIRGTHATMDPVEIVYQVVNANNMGAAALPNAIPGANNGLPTTDGTTITQNVNVKAGQLVFKKNVARANFAFPMYDSTGALKTGLTVTAAVRKDAGASFTPLAGSVTEIGTTGWYTVDFAQAETNADTVAFSASASGANPTCYTILTQA
jgi:hypothetical protein